MEPLIRRLLKWLGGALLALVLVALAGGWWFSEAGHEGPITDHFDGSRFLNQIPRVRDPVGAATSAWETSSGPWERRALDQRAKPVERVDGSELVATFVGHATVLIQTEGLNLLTDPHWSTRASPVSFAGPERFHPPGIAFEDLPPIDAVVISHNHYDHTDLDTLRRLAAAHGPRIFVPLGVERLLEANGIEGAEPGDWWQVFDLGEGRQLHGVPAQHFSSRGFFDRDTTLWMGWALQTASGLSYFAGDTASGPQFRQVRNRLGPPRLVLMPIGAYLPSGMMRSVHVDPAEAVAGFLDCGAANGIPIHHGTFKLGMDGQDQPVKALKQALLDQGLAPRSFQALAPGASRQIPSLDRLHTARAGLQIGKGRPASLSPSSAHTLPKSSP